MLICEYKNADMKKKITQLFKKMGFWQHVLVKAALINKISFSDNCWIAISFAPVFLS